MHTNRKNKHKRREDPKEYKIGIVGEMVKEDRKNKEKKKIRKGMVKISKTTRYNKQKC